QIDVVAWELNKNVPAEVAMLADPRASLTELAELISNRLSPAQATAADERAKATAKQTAARRERYWEQAKARWDDTPITGPRLMSEIRDALPDGALVFQEALSNQRPVT